MPEHITLEEIREKRTRFMKRSARFTVVTAVLFITVGYLLLTFWLCLILAAVITLVSSITFITINRLYLKKIITSRNKFIQTLFPIKEHLTKQQSRFILSDLTYLFGDNGTVLDHKLRTNNLSTKDIERLNILYANYFIDLTTIQRKSG